MLPSSFLGDELDNCRIIVLSAENLVDFAIHRLEIFTAIVRMSLYTAEITAETYYRFHPWINRKGLN